MAASPYSLSCLISIIDKGEGTYYKKQNMLLLCLLLRKSKDIRHIVPETGPRINLTNDIPVTLIT